MHFTSLLLANMARKALVNKTQEALSKAAQARALGKKVTFPTRLYHRCSVCGRAHGYIGKFDMCRICVRERANAGELMGVRKSSW
jgi:small subunit ribosomal protein S14